MTRQRVWPRPSAALTGSASSTPRPCWVRMPVKPALPRNAHQTRPSQLGARGGAVKRMYVVALATGVLVGIIYALLDIRSPAPPVGALVGLLGILMGEQVTPMAKRLPAGEPISVGWLK